MRRSYKRQPGKRAADADVDTDPVVDLQDPLPQRGHRLVDENGPGLGVTDDVGDLVRGEVSVHRAVVQPGKLAAPGDLEELRAVRKYQRDAVAAPQPGIMQERPRRVGSS